MTEKKKSRVSAWLVIGVLVLIALLIIWLTIADFMGDTDVAAKASIEAAKMFNTAYALIPNLL